MPVMARPRILVLALVLLVSYTTVSSEPAGPVKDIVNSVPWWPESNLAFEEAVGVVSRGVLFMTGMFMFMLDSCRTHVILEPEQECELRWFGCTQRGSEQECDGSDAHTGEPFIAEYDATPFACTPVVRTPLPPSLPPFPVACLTTSSRAHAKSRLLLRFTPRCE